MAGICKYFVVSRVGNSTRILQHDVKNGIKKKNAAAGVPRKDCDSDRETASRQPHTHIYKPCAPIQLFDDRRLWQRVGHLFHHGLLCRAFMVPHCPLRRLKEAGYLRFDGACIVVTFLRGEDY